MLTFQRTLQASPPAGRPKLTLPCSSSHTMLVGLCGTRCPTRAAGEATRRRQAAHDPESVVRWQRSSLCCLASEFRTALCDRDPALFPEAAALCAAGKPEGSEAGVRECALAGVEGAFGRTGTEFADLQPETASAHQDASPQAHAIPDGGGVGELLARMQEQHALCGGTRWRLGLRRFGARLSACSQLSSSSWILCSVQKVVYIKFLCDPGHAFARFLPSVEQVRVAAWEEQEYAEERDTEEGTEGSSFSLAASAETKRRRGGEG